MQRLTPAEITQRLAALAAWREEGWQKNDPRSALDGIDFDGSTLTGCSFDGATYTRSDLRDRGIGDETLAEMVSSGVVTP